ncbi:MAG: NAD-dependent epimerase/dehydratase family protein [Planctomycetia bacterium]|nr:NAD-dependent epimerase/dehydratase family protein [Planctomycetia bacterium]
MLNLVTGPGGFLGRYITEQLLSRGQKVRGFSRGDYPYLQAMGVEMVRGDISDAQKLEEACRGVDTIYHVAGLCGIGEPWERFYRTNTYGTHCLLEAARKAGVKKFIYTSSSSVSFDGYDQKNVTVEPVYPTRWLCHYSHSKALAEQEVLQMNGKDGLLTCSLRPHLVWGPRDNSLIPRLISRAAAGSLKRVGSGKNLVDMIYVENAAAAHLQAADALAVNSPVAGNVYFLSHGQPVNCWEWIDELLEIYQLPPVKHQISYAAAWSAGWFFEKIWKIFSWETDPPMTRFLAGQLAKDHYYDISPAKRDFGFSPTITKEQGMEALKKEFSKTKGVPFS